MAMEQSKKSGQQSSIVQVASDSLLGRDGIVKLLIQSEQPLTRENYRSVAGLTEDEMTPELEANLPDEFQLTEEGFPPPEVVMVQASQMVPTREEMLAAGIPEPLHSAVPMYDSLEEAAEALAS